jgi:hypothetical protein
MSRLNLDNRRRPRNSHPSISEEEKAMRSVVLIVLLAAAPASAQYAEQRPGGAAPALGGCNLTSGYPDCRLDRIYEGRSVGILPRPVPNATMHLYPADVPYHPVDRW